MGIEEWDRASRNSHAGYRYPTEEYPVAHKDRDEKQCHGASSGPQKQKGSCQVAEGDSLQDTEDAQSVDGKCWEAIDQQSQAKDDGSPAERLADED